MDRINHEQAEARELVAKLHATADTFEAAAKRHLDVGFNHLGEAIRLTIEHAEQSAHANNLAKAEGNAAKQALQMTQLLRDAAVLLDSYQAGHALATPHHLTGFALVPVAEHIDMPEAA